MTKQDLKNGMIVELRDGDRMMYCEGIMRGLDDFEDINTYEDNLTCSDKEMPELDIMKVYEDRRMFSLRYVFLDNYLKLIWERLESQMLSPEEIEILKALDVIGFTHIARNESGNIFAYQSKPAKDRAGVWFFNNTVHPDEMGTSHLKRYLFSFVDWKDKEPTSIKKLLEQSEEVSQWIKQK